MSNRTSREKASVHAKRGHCCSCGRIVFGNGGKWSHRQACQGMYLTSTEFHRRFELDPEQDGSEPGVGRRFIPLRGEPS